MSLVSHQQSAPLFAVPQALPSNPPLMMMTHTQTFVQYHLPVDPQLVSHQVWQQHAAEVQRHLHQHLLIHQQQNLQLAAQAMRASFPTQPQVTPNSFDNHSMPIQDSQSSQLLVTPTLVFHHQQENNSITDLLQVHAQLHAQFVAQAAAQAIPVPSMHMHNSYVPNSFHQQYSLMRQQHEEALRQSFEQSLRTRARPASSIVVDSLPSHTVSGACDSMCTVCHDDFESGQVATSMPCSHTFHKDCLTPWLAQNNSCPVCRFELPTNDPTYDAQLKHQSFLPESK